MNNNPDQYSSQQVSRRRALQMLGGGGVALATAGLVGCGGDDDGDSPTTEANDRSNAPTTIDYVRAGVPEEPPSFDIHRANGGAANLWTVNVFEGLVTRSVTGEIIPQLAESWTAAADGKSIEFKLRQGVKFHTGDPFTAEDVKFSFDRLKDPKIQTKQGNQAHWEELQIVDPFTVKFVVNKPDPTLLGYLANDFYFDVASKAHHNREGDDGFENNPVGTGRFKFKSRAVKEYWELDANQEHWMGAPAVQRIRFNIIPEPSTMAAALQAGEIDIASNIAPQLASQFSGNGYRLIKNPATQTIGARVNTLRAKSPNGGPNPYADVRVRKAMNLAIDRDGIIKGIIHGFGEKVSGLFPEDVGYPKDLQPYAYDPKEAKALLSATGYSEQDLSGIWLGLIGQRVPNATQVGEAIAANLAAIGIKLQVRNEEYAVWVEGVASRNIGKPNEMWPAGLMITAWGGAFHSQYGFNAYLHSKGASSWFSNAKVDSLLAEMDLPENAERVPALCEQVARIAYEENAGVIGYRSIVGYAMRDDIKFTPSVNSSYIEAWNISRA